MLWKALRLVGCGERIRSDFESQLVAAFEVEDSEDRQLCTADSVSIGLLKTVRIELLEMKKRFWCFRKQGFSMLALFL